jgi:hypothetical protein
MDSVVLVAVSVGVGVGYGLGASVSAAAPSGERVARGEAAAKGGRTPIWNNTTIAAMPVTPAAVTAHHRRTGLRWRNGPGAVGVTSSG